MLLTFEIWLWYNKIMRTTNNPEQGEKTMETTELLRAMCTHEYYARRRLVMESLFQDLYESILSAFDDITLDTDKPAKCYDETGYWTE